jgi:hypothetical protein
MLRRIAQINYLHDLSVPFAVRALELFFEFETAEIFTQVQSKAEVKAAKNT